MRPTFQPTLVNGPFGDPCLYVDFMHEGRALLFDLGDLSALPPRKLLRVSHAFVTHAHMDHFVGFDRLLRVCIGRAHAVHLFGPPGFVAQVEHRLAAYTWNLVANYETNFTIAVTEVAADGAAQAARFQCKRAFAREALPPTAIDDGVLLDEDAFRVRAALLDHQVPCLGFAIEEKTHVNVWKNRLAELGLPVGAWLKDLKQAVARGDPDAIPFRAWWREAGTLHELTLPLGELKARVLRLVPGQKIGYVTDVVGNAENGARIAALVRDADLLFIEAMFVEQDAAHAARKFHLTARQAGAIAREARARSVIPFHVSPRYAGTEARVFAELGAAFGAGSVRWSGRNASQAADDGAQEAPGANRAESAGTGPLRRKSGSP
jgi:ribonuclease Z